MMKLFASVTYLVTGLVLVCGYNSHAMPAPDILDLVARTYDPQISAVEEDVTGNFDLCRKTTVTVTAKDPISLQPGTITLQTYVRRWSSRELDKQLKTVIVLPPTGGETVLDRGYAARLCLSGFRAAVVQRWSNDNPQEVELEMHDRAALRSLAAVRHVVEYLDIQRPDQLGIMGNSVGAITSALVLGYEKRITAGALIVGGVGMPEIIANSTEQNLTKLRELRMKAFNYPDVAAYEKDLATHIRIDPKDSIGMSGPKKIWTMIALQDVTVPTKNQFDLYKAFGSQKDVLTNDDAHIETIVSTSLLKADEIIDFFKANLK